MSEKAPIGTGRLCGIVVCTIPPSDALFVYCVGGDTFTICWETFTCNVKKTHQVCGAQIDSSPKNLKFKHTNPVLFYVVVETKKDNKYF